MHRLRPGAYVVTTPAMRRSVARPHMAGIGLGQTKTSTSGGTTAGGLIGSILGGATEAFTGIFGTIRESQLAERELGIREQTARTAQMEAEAAIEQQARAHQLRMAQLEEERRARAALALPTGISPTVMILLGVGGLGVLGVIMYLVMRKK